MDIHSVFDQLLAFRAQLEIFADILAKKGVLTAEEATTIPLLFKVWKPGSMSEPADYPVDGTIWRDPFDGHLYKVKSGMGHKAYGDENFAPSRYHAGWEPVAEPGEDGSREHPFTFVSGMSVTSGLYYKQDSLLCRCTRSEAHLYGELANFVGSYMEIVT